MEKHRQRMGANQPLAILALVGYLIAAPARADWDATVTTGLGYSDNVGRRATNTADDTIANVQSRFSIDENTPRLFVDVVGNVGYYRYLDDTFDPEFLGNVAADMKVTLVEDYLRWLFTDNFGQVLTDPFTPATPTNRENFNYFATGPQAEFQLGGQLRLGLGAQYSRSDYEISPFDANGVLAHISLTHDFSEHSGLGLNARYMDVEFDDIDLLENSYTQDELFLRYDAEGARTHLIADAGYSSFDQDFAPDTESGPIFRLDVTRQLTARSVLILNAGHEFSNSSIVYSQMQNGLPLDLEMVGGRQTVDPFMNTRAALRWDYEGTRSGFTLSGGYRDEDYRMRPELDQQLVSFAAETQRYMTPSLDLDIRASYLDVKFDQPGGDYDEIDATVGLNWRMTRTIGLWFSYQYAKRDSELASASYDENRVWLSVGWQRGNPRHSVMNRFDRSRRNPEAN